MPRKSHGKGKHSPPSDLHTNRKSSLRISSWSPHSWRDKDRQVGAVQSPPQLGAHPTQPAPGTVLVRAGSWNGSRAASRPCFPSQEVPQGGESSPGSETHSWNRGQPGVKLRVSRASSHRHQPVAMPAARDTLAKTGHPAVTQEQLRKAHSGWGHLGCGQHGNNEVYGDKCSE